MKPVVSRAMLMSVAARTELRSTQNASSVASATIAFISAGSPWATPLRCNSCSPDTSCRRNA